MDISNLIPEMLDAAAKIAKKRWPSVRDYLLVEIQKFNSDLKTIENLLKNKQITESQAKLHIKMHKNSMKSVLLTVKGIGVITAEEIINACFNVIRTFVNSSINFPLI